MEAVGLYCAIAIPELLILFSLSTFGNTFLQKFAMPSFVLGILSLFALMPIYKMLAEYFDMTTCLSLTAILAIIIFILGWSVRHKNDE